MMFFCSIWRSSLRNCIDASHPWESNFPSFPSLFNKTVSLVTGFFRSAQQSLLKSVRFLLLSIQFNFLFNLATLNYVQLFSPFSFHCKSHPWAWRRQCKIFEVTWRRNGRKKSSHDAIVSCWMWYLNFCVQNYTFDVMLMTLLFVEWTKM